MTSLGRLFHCLMGPQCLTIFPNDFTGLVSSLHIAWSSFEHIVCNFFYYFESVYDIIINIPPLVILLVGQKIEDYLCKYMHSCMSRILYVHAKLNLNAQTTIYIYVLYTSYPTHVYTHISHARMSIF